MTPIQRPTYGSSHSSLREWALIWQNWWKV